MSITVRRNSKAIWLAAGGHPQQMTGIAFQSGRNQVANLAKGQFQGGLSKIQEPSPPSASRMNGLGRAVIDVWMDRRIHPNSSSQDQHVTSDTDI